MFYLLRIIDGDGCWAIVAEQFACNQKYLLFGRRVDPAHAPIRKDYKQNGGRTTKSKANVGPLALKLSVACAVFGWVFEKIESRQRY